MSYRVAEPLPECQLCEKPTARAAHEENGGLCTDCLQGIGDTVRMLPVRGADVVDLAERRRRLQGHAVAQDDATVFVERFIPPVPGQLELGDDQ